jgi:hypothetical protein
MSDQPRFHWKLIDMTNKNMLTAENILRIRPSRLFEHVQDVLQNGQPSFSYQLIEDFVIKPKGEVPEKLVPYISGLQSQHLVTAHNLPPAKYELDLHFEQIAPGVTGLDPDAILKRQLQALEHNIHLAIAHRQERMVVIHGLGKGKLREEVHAFLKNVHEVNRFKNEWSGKYGFGATEVFFKY